MPNGRSPAGATPSSRPRRSIQIATIVDIGNQLLRHSEGAAQANVRRRLGKYVGLAEGNWIVNAASGSSSSRAPSTSRSS
jgi:hypothetical protein